MAKTPWMIRTKRHSRRKIRIYNRIRVIMITTYEVMKIRTILIASSLA